MLYIITAVILTIAIVFNGAKYFLIEKRKLYFKWADEAKANGPWSDQAIWISDNKDIYLICVQKHPEEFSYINTYVYYEGSWVLCDMHWISGTKTVKISEKTTGEILLTGEFSIKDGSFNIKKLSEPSEHNFLQGRSSISLSKYLYDQQITQLPFDFENGKQ